MTHLTLDAITLERLRSASDSVEVHDESGIVVGYFHPIDHQSSSPSPHSREQLEQLRLQRTGRPLADILRDLGAS